MTGSAVAVAAATTPAATAEPAGAAAAAGARGRRQPALLRLRGEIPTWLRLTLGVLGVAALLGGWQLAASSMASDSFLVPTPADTVRAGWELHDSGELAPALAASSERVAVGYAISLAIGIVLGLAVGSFRSAEAFLEPQMGFLRYVPASALTPLFLLWLGIDEAPRIALIVVGTVFYNVLMIADVARAVPRELIHASYTLGARRWTVLRRVVLPHSYPGIVDVARINLASAWLMLVVAELLAAEEGLAFRVARATRFRDVDTMFALLIVFGIIGLATDLLLRLLRRRTASWSHA